MLSQTCAPSAPRCCAHGRERQGRSVERAEGPTLPSSTATPWSFVAIFCAQTM
jgi:hypothetical protein